MISDVILKYIDYEYLNEQLVYSDIDADIK